MKNLIRLIDAFLTAMVRYNRGKLFIDPLTIGAIIGGTKLLTKIGSDIAAKKKTKKLEAQRAKEMAENKKQAEAGLNVAKGIARMGDPTLGQKRRDISRSATDAVGKTVATSGSSQEVINAIQGIQRNQDVATGAAESQAGATKMGAAQFYASQFGEAGRQKILGEGAIDRRTQMSLAAIQQQAQSNVDTAANLGSNVMDAKIYSDLVKGKLSPEQYNTVQGGNPAYNF